MKSFYKIIFRSLEIVLQIVHPSIKFSLNLSLHVSTLGFSNGFTSTFAYLLIFSHAHIYLPPKPIFRK